MSEKSRIRINMKTRKPLAIAGTLLVALVALLPLPWAPAAAQGGLKGLSCAAIGCGGGGRDCAEMSFTITAGADVGIAEAEGSIEVTLFCHEPAASN